MEKTTDKIKIMIADDHNLLREGLKQLLEFDGSMKIIAEASDGIECLKILNNVNPDILLLDINMPLKNGIEVLEELKVSKPDLKILILTVHGEVEYLIKAIDIGADGYIMKGTSSSNLLNAIETVSEHAAWIDSAIARVVLSNIQHEQQIAPSVNKQSEANKKYGLTKKELEVLSLIVDGLSNQEISEKLVVSISTTKAHVHNILQKLYLTDRTKAAIVALKEGLV